MTTIKADFLDDLRHGLVSLIKSGGYQVGDDLTHDQASVAYYNIKHRLISPARRRVVWSRELAERQLSSELRAGIARIEADAVAGENLEKYLSDRVVKEPTEHDLLLNDWHIHHMHLGRPVAGRRFVRRTKELLFVHVDPDAMYLIELLDHRAWTNDGLIRSMRSNWPEVMEKFRLPGVTSVGPAMTSKDVSTMRHAGLSIVWPGEAGPVFAGMGYVSTGLSLQVRMAANSMLGHVDQLQKDCDTNAQRMASMIAERTGKPAATELHLRLLVEEGRGQPVFSIRDEESGLRFGPPR